MNVLIQLHSVNGENFKYPDYSVFTSPLAIFVVLINKICLYADKSIHLSVVTNNPPAGTYITFIQRRIDVASTLMRSCIYKMVKQTKYHINYIKFC